MRYTKSDKSITLVVDDNENTEACVREVIKEVEFEFRGSIYAQKGGRNYTYMVHCGFYKRKTDSGLKKGWFDIDGNLLTNMEFKKLQEQKLLNDNK